MPGQIVQRPWKTPWRKQAGCTNREEGQDVPESVIEAFVTKIVVSKDGFDWYLSFDGDPDDPLHCQIEDGGRGEFPCHTYWKHRLQLRNLSN